MSKDNKNSIIFMFFNEQSDDKSNQQWRYDNSQTWKHEKSTSESIYQKSTGNSGKKLEKS
jgi:hypothetical protein